MPIKSRWTRQFTEIDSSSKFHNEVRRIFATDPFFKNLHCYQEVPVSDLVPEYQSNQHRFDWYIDELNIIVELHGRQHYEAVHYGPKNTKSHGEIQHEFKMIQARDEAKKQAAISANFQYVAIPYTYYNKLNGQLLKQLVLEAIK